ncbi:MAG TPA: membrane-associated oxidoreductase, partial [Streptomyces sp.]|nr:membrane-associated oxidoreductase [Streptomyces sp.]
MDFRQADDDPERGDVWGADRTVRAEVVRALLLGGVSEDGEIAALRLSGVRISGLLNLQYATVDCAIRLWACHFEQTPILYGAKVRQLNLSESCLPALNAATIRVEGVLRLTDCRIPGEVRLGGAEISGALFLDRAHLGEDGGGEDPVLQLNQATINDDLWAPGLVAHGEVRLSGARVTGAVSLDDARLSAPDGTALQAEAFTVGSNLSARRLRTNGRVNLRGSKFPGQIDLTGAHLS